MVAGGPLDERLGLSLFLLEHGFSAQEGIGCRRVAIGQPGGLPLPKIPPSLRHLGSVELDEDLLIGRPGEDLGLDLDD
jgi:hypothetical protein